MTTAFYEVLQSRRSIRRYQNRPISRPTLETILTAATYAPSAHNRQPWRFAVITTAETQRKLASAMGAKLRADLTADGAAQDVIEKDVSRSYSRLTGAAGLIVVCLSMVDMDHYPDERRCTAERLMAVQSTALAAQNLLLAAHAEGLGACWMCAPLFCPEVVQEQLALPVDWEPQAVITLGYPAESKQSTRHPLETRVAWR